MSIEADLDRLYQLPPAEFIAERNAIAKRAGTRGAEIRALPKPTLPVWVVNQLYWQQPDAYRALTESAENLRATHKAVLGGGGGDLRGASKAHEEALDAALKAALAIAAANGHPPSDAARQTIGTTLRALPGTDPPGRLQQALMPGGFEALAGLPAGGRVVPAPAGRAGKTAGKKKPATAAPGATIDKAAVARAQKALDDAVRAVTEAEQAARREEFEAARASREAERADRRSNRAREALDTAETELHDAEREAAAAAKKRDAARSRAEAADEALNTARARAERARDELRAAESAE
jgi:hypothetical protein